MNNPEYLRRIKELARQYVEAERQEDAKGVEYVLDLVPPHVCLMDNPQSIGSMSRIWWEFWWEVKEAQNA
jgi:hypothetical protein